MHVPYDYIGEFFPVWVQNLRMDKETFTFICEDIREFIEKANTNFKKAPTVEMRVFILVHAINGLLVIYLGSAHRQFAIFYMQLMKPLF